MPGEPGEDERHVVAAANRLVSLFNRLERLQPSGQRVVPAATSADEVTERLAALVGELPPAQPAAPAAAPLTRTMDRGSACSWSTGVH